VDRCTRRGGTGQHGLSLDPWIGRLLSWWPRKGSGGGSHRDAAGTGPAGATIDLGWLPRGSWIWPGRERSGSITRCWTRRIDGLRPRDRACRLPPKSGSAPA
jgi:hypothetical protein